MSKWLGTIVFACLLMGWVKPVNAQVQPEQIDNFQSNIAVNQDSVATITETITYDFGSYQRHGIRRFIPIKTRAADGGTYYYDFKLLKASVDGHSVETQLSKQGVYKVMRLGDPNVTISGTHTYAITYQVWPVVLRDPEGAFFNWNLTGNDWEVPIKAVTANITFPDGASVQASRCYSGVRGSTAQNCQITVAQNKLTLTNTAPLDSGEGLTLNALLPAGSFNSYLEPNRPPPSEWLPVLGFAVGVLALIFGVSARLISWLIYRWKRSRELIIPQYESPDGLSPGEIGLLNDNRSNMTEITATLIDLAVRGFIRIEQIQDRQLFKKAKYKFHLLKSYVNVKDFEKKLLDMLFDSGAKKTVELDSIKANTAAKAIRDVQSDFKAELKDKGYLAMATTASWWRKARNRLVWLLMLAVLAANIYALIKGANFGFILFSTAVAFLGIIFGFLLAKRIQLTHAGYKQWAEVQGLKLFLTVTEKERLKFHDAPAKNPKLFNKLLPFAIALGVERQWAKQFEGMDIEKNSGWYSGHHHFNSVYLATSLSNDFSRSVSSNFTPTQSSGSYSGGGGGSSGGGGGGGGGGSW